MRPVFSRHLYLSGEEAVAVAKEAENIAKRERLSFNKLVLEALKEYVRRHGKANYNFTLDTFGAKPIRALPVERGKITLKHVKSYPINELEQFLEGAKKEVEIFSEALVSSTTPKKRVIPYCKIPPMAIVVNKTNPSTECAVCEKHMQNYLDSGKWELKRG